MDDLQKQHNLEYSEQDEVSPEEIVETLREEDPQAYDAADDEIEEYLRSEKFDSIYNEQKTELLDNSDTTTRKNFPKDNIILNTIIGGIKSRKLKTAGRFLLNSIIRTPTVVRHSEVTDYRVSEENNSIELKICSPDVSSTKCRDSEIKEQWVTFDLDEPDDLEKLDFMISQTNISEPSNLIGQEVPSYSVTTRGFRRKAKLYQYPKSPVDKFNYYFTRGLLKFRLMEPVTDGTRRNLFINRNFFLASTLLFGVISLLTSFTMGFAQLFFFIYCMMIFGTTVRGVHDVIMNEEGERNYIEDFLY